MHKNSFIYLILPLLIISCNANTQNTLTLSAGQSSPKAQLKDISWITGHWKGTAFGGDFEEVWLPVMGNSTMGTFKLVVDGKVNFYEMLTIVEEDETLTYRLKHFHGDLKGWEEKDEVVEFKLVKMEDRAVYFDGLTFRRINKNLLHVFVVVGDDNGKEEEVKFIFNRVIN